MNIRILLRRITSFRINPIVIIISLAVGITCVNLIGLFIYRELQTDSFHQNNENIYSLVTNNPFEKGKHEYFCRAGAAEFIEQNFSQVESFCRYHYSPCIKTEVNQTTYYEPPKVLAVSPNFFEFFSFELLSNNPKTALATSSDIVISKELARKYFGEVSPIGQTIRISDGGSEKDFIVNGIFRKPEQNSQLSFDIVRKNDYSDSPCFLRLKPGASKTEVEELLARNVNTIPTLHGKHETKYNLLSLRQTYFDPIQRSKVELNRDFTDLKIALGAGLLILLIALFNYLVLVNNNLQDRHKDYAIRIVNGSSKGGLVKDFMFENIAFLLISFVISIGIMYSVFPLFNTLVRTNLQAEYLLHRIPVLLISGTLVVIAIVCYAFVLIRIRTIYRVNKQIFRKSEKAEDLSFSILNIFQLAASILLIVVSLVVIRQMRYISDKPLGINKDVIEIKVPWGSSEVVPAFLEELQKGSSISSTSAVYCSPVLDNWKLRYTYYKNGEELTYDAVGFEGDENYLETLGIRILEGTDFSRRYSNQNKCLINQTLANLFPDEYIVGKHLPGTDYIVTGIVEDFHYYDLKRIIEPALILYTNKGTYLLAKPTKGQEREAIDYISSLWSEFIPDYAVNIESIENRFEWLHRENKGFIQLIVTCCVISIFLSMIGLFAVSADKCRKRIKEIGIRKVNGAKIAEILSLLNKQFIYWVIVAFIISTPIAWILAQGWLNNFAYKTNINWLLFSLAGFIALSITMLTISWQAYMAASKNPVESLKYE